MALSEDLAVLESFGISINPAGVAKLATLIRNVQALVAGGLGGLVMGKKRGRPRMGAASSNGAPKGKRGPRSSFTVSRDDLAKMRSDGMTAKEIGKKHGVSVATVNLHLKKHGLTKKRKAKSAKK